MHETSAVFPFASPATAGDPVVEHSSASHTKAVQVALASITAEGGIPLIYGPAGSGKAHVAQLIERTLESIRTPRLFDVYQIDAATLDRANGALLGAIAAHLDVRLPREVWARLAAVEKRGVPAPNVRKFTVRPSLPTRI